MQYFISSKGIHLFFKKNLQKIMAPRDELHLEYQTYIGTYVCHVGVSLSFLSIF